MNLARQPLLDHDLPCHDVRALSLHFLAVQLLLESPEEEEKFQKQWFSSFL